MDIVIIKEFAAVQPNMKSLIAEWQPHKDEVLKQASERTVAYEVLQELNGDYDEGQHDGRDAVHNDCQGASAACTLPGRKQVVSEGRQRSNST
jgi:hypothetical protein